jgi:hypothetical protein
MPSGSLKNSDFYVEVADYLKAHRAFSPVSLAIANSSQVLAESVIVTMKVDAKTSIEAADADYLPDFPTRIGIPLTHPPLARSTHVTTYGSLYEIKVDLGNIQPGRITYSEQPFYLSSKSDLDAVLEATISADNLPSPINVPLNIALRPTIQNITVREIIEFARSPR